MLAGPWAAVILLAWMLAPAFFPKPGRQRRIETGATSSHRFLLLRRTLTELDI